MIIHHAIICQRKRNLACAYTFVVMEVGGLWKIFYVCNYFPVTKILVDYKYMKDQSKFLS